MNIAQKLRIVRQLSGLTQEKMAQKLGVSFPTINSWMNEKSIPHTSKQKTIDALYREVTGQQESPESALVAKKQIIEEKRKKFNDILGVILERPDIYNQFMLSLTYNTNRIEGSTLTEPETAAILFDNVSLPNRNIIEQMEVKNHQSALDFLLRHIRKAGKINGQFILKIHGILMNGIRQDAGGYRNHDVRIVGANVPTANYMRVPGLMESLLKEVNDTPKDVIGHCAKIHSRLEQIHPFSDGNGRIGRLIIHAMLLRKNYPPAVIKQEKKRFYLKYLNRAQLKNEFDDLEDFFCDSILEGFKILG